MTKEIEPEANVSPRIGDGRCDNKKQPCSSGWNNELPAPLMKQFDMRLQEWVRPNRAPTSSNDRGLSVPSKRTYQRRFANFTMALMRAGYQEPELSNLAFCLRRDVIEDGLRAMLTPMIGHRPISDKTVLDCACLLLMLVRMHKDDIPERDVAWLGAVTKKLARRMAEKVNHV